MKKAVLFYTLLICCTGHLNAQVEFGSVSGCVMSATEGSRSSVGGVLVELCVPNDTMRLSTTYTGMFFFKKVPAGKYTIRFSHMSYKTLIKQVEVKEKTTVEVYADLQEETRRIGEVVVKGEIPVFTTDGDTLIYNAAAIRTQEGDETLRIIEQLPGVETSEAGVKVLGRDITRTYIDGKLVFGSDPMAALRNLLADDVVKIRAYDEYADRRPNRKRRKGDAMERVFNIETKSKLINATTGHFLASYGADLNKGSRSNHNRYGLGATANFFSEKLLLSANAFGNNIGRKSNRITDILTIRDPQSSYDRNNYVDLGLVRKWGEDGERNSELNASYTYDDSYSRSEASLRQRYFPSADYTEREYSDTSRNAAKMRSHNAHLHWTRRGDKAVLELSHRMTFSKSSDRSYQAAFNRVDELPATGSRSRNNRGRTFYNLEELAYWSTQITDYIDISLDGSVSLQDGDGSGIRADALTSSTRRQLLNSSSIGRSQSVNARASFSFALDEETNNSIDLAYIYKYENSHSRQTALDTSDPARQFIDTTNTFDYTNRSQTHQEKISFYLSLPKLEGTLQLSAMIQSAGIDRNERFPGHSRYDKWFHAVLPSIGWASFSMMKQFSIRYNTYASLPSVEQLRSQIDNKNPFMLVGGNPSLKQSYTHSFGVKYNRIAGKKNHTIGIGADFKLTNRQIAYKQIFFTEATRLEPWGYVAPAQSTLTTYENVNDWMSGNFNVN